MVREDFAVPGEGLHKDQDAKQVFKHSKKLWNSGINILSDWRLYESMLNKPPAGYDHCVGVPNINIFLII